MKQLLKICTLAIITIGAIYSPLFAVERLASGMCTHSEPKFVRKQVRDDQGNILGEKLVIDIGGGEEIPAGQDWDSSWLASNDPRITFDYDLKTRRLYRCNQINDPADKGGLAVECKRRGFDHGIITNGSERCSTTW